MLYFGLIVERMNHSDNERPVIHIPPSEFGLIGWSRINRKGSEKEMMYKNNFSF